MKLKATVLAGAVALGLSGVASAASFDFAGPTIANNQNSFTFSSGGINVTVTAGSGQVSSYWEGLGVKNGLFDVTPLGNNESLTFTFNQTVTLGGLSMRQWEPGADEALLTTNKGQDVVISGAGVGANGATLVDYFTFATPLVLNSFTIKGTNGVTQAYVLGLQNVNAYTPPAEVPVPAAAWLMGSALMGLAGIARRRKLDA